MGRRNNAFYNCKQAFAGSGAAMAVEKNLRSIDGLGSIASTASLVRPETAVRSDFAKAADLGVTSTVLSLLVIPVVYNYLDDLGQWAMRIYARLQKN